MQRMEDSCGCRNIRRAEIDGKVEGSSCAVADGRRSCTIIGGVKTDVVCGDC